jgi:hypothetical protein
MKATITNSIVGNALDLYSIGNRNGSNTIRANDTDHAVQSFGVSVGGKIFLAPPQNNVVVVYLRGYMGLSLITRQDFSLRVTNDNPRVDTTVRVERASGLVPFVGFTPGLEFRSDFLSLSLEFFGLQFHPNQTLFPVNIGVSFLF